MGAHSTKQDIIVNFLENSLENQSFYRKNANTINGVVASVAATLVFVLTLIQTAGYLPGTEAAIAFIIPIITGLALKLTTNGIGKKSVEKIIEKGEEPTSDDALPAFRVNRE